jgi:hypothetical protein
LFRIAAAFRERLAAERAEPRPSQLAEELGAARDAMAEAASLLESLSEPARREVSEHGESLIANALPTMRDLVSLLRDAAHSLPADRGGPRNPRLDWLTPKAWLAFHAWDLFAVYRPAELSARRGGPLHEFAESLLSYAANDASNVVAAGTTMYTRLRDIEKVIPLAKELEASRTRGLLSLLDPSQSVKSRR